jgi:hypothetical protein
MTSGEDARRLVLYGNRRALGGNMIRMSFVTIHMLYYYMIFILYA